MSTTQWDPKSVETQQQREKGPEAYLSQQERDTVRRLLKFPEEFPREFAAWLLEQVQTNGQVLRSSIIGMPQFQAKTAQVAAAESTGYGAYTDLATVGPTVSGMADGTYLILFGAQLSVTANRWGDAMSISINGSTAVDGDGFAVTMVTAEGAEVEAFSLPGFRAVLKTLENNNNNEIKCKYRHVQDTPAGFSNRWLVAWRIGN